MLIVMYYPDSIGHLALALTGLGKEKNIYISFFPPNFSTPAGFRLHSLEHDNEHSVGQMVILPTVESCGFGLSEQAVYDWWKNRFVEESGNFSWLTNNCASVVYKALYQGQIHSNAMQETSIKKKGFCTPGTVLLYARELAKSLLGKQNKKDALHSMFDELLEHCELGQLTNPIQQTLAIYSRMKTVNSNKHSFILNTPFCRGIKTALNKLNQLLTRTNRNSDDQHIRTLIALSNTDDLFDTNIHTHHEKFCVLVNHLLKSRAQNALTEKLEKLIQTHLISTLSEQIKAYKQPYLETRQTIHPARQTIRQEIEDRKNPHQGYYNKGDDLGRQRYARW